MQNNSYPKLAIFYGLILIVLGPLGYFLSGQASMTAFIPTALGVLAVIAGVLAKSKLSAGMHLAVLISILAIGGTAKALGQAGTIFGGEGEIPWAVLFKCITAVVSIVFLLISINSFIAARKAKG